MEFIEVEKIKHNSFHRYISSQVTNDLQTEVLTFLFKLAAKMQGKTESN